MLTKTFHWRKSLSPPTGGVKKWQSACVRTEIPSELRRDETGRLRNGGGQLAAASTDARAVEARTISSGSTVITFG